jgi:carboxyl-terminal processing protease
MPRAAGRHVLRGVALVAALAVAYGGGVVTGVVGAGVDEQRRRDEGVVHEAAARISDRAARRVGQQELERAAVEGMLDALGDRWSSYYSAHEYEGFQRELRGHYSGVGVWLQASQGDGARVTRVQPGSPAARAGVRAGDRLTEVDGRAADGVPVSTLTEWLRGPGGTHVALSVDGDGPPRRTELVRAEVRTEEVTARPLGRGLVRVPVASFRQGVGRDVRRVVGDADAPRQGIVLDLRGNPGGLVEEAVAVASVFLDGGPVVTYERRGSRSRTLDAASGGDEATPLVVLVDQGTASAAEMLAASLQDRNRAVVVGSRTVGKGSVQEPLRLSDGSALSLTVGRYLTPSGTSVEGVGVEPDVFVRPDAPGGVAERRAEEVLTGLTASLPSDGRG